jgi:hypothetical protein
MSLEVGSSGREREVPIHPGMEKRQEEPTRPMRQPPPPPPAASSSLSSGIAQAESVAPQAGYRPTGPVDPKYGDGYFVKSAPTTPPAIDVNVEPSSASSPNSASKQIVVLLVGVVAAVLGYLGWQAMSSQDSVVYMGDNDRIDVVDSKSFFVPLDGYAYRDIPSAAKKEMKGLMSQVGGIYGVKVDATIKGVTQNGQFAGAVIAIGMPPKVAQAALEEEDPAAVLDAQMPGQELERIEVGGKPAFGVQYGPASGVIAFYENQVLIVTAASETSTTQIAETILSAQP